MSNDEQQTRVVKLGGSLLELPDLAGRLRCWFAVQPAACDVIVVGGGRLVDIIRDYDRLHVLNQTDAHWLAIRAMELNSRFVASFLPEARWLDSLRALQEFAAGLCILNPWKFMSDDDGEHPVGRLPTTWAVTSDSIAARITELSHAGELVLLKSALPPVPATVTSAVNVGYLDPFFAEASRRLSRIRCVNLCDPSLQEVCLSS